MIDKYALFQLGSLMDGIEGSFRCYQFYKVYKLVQKFAVVDLSNFYFDTAKDRLYVGGKKSYTRLSCQTVLAAHLLCLVRAIAPILPHLAEDTWEHLPFQYCSGDGSNVELLFEAGWPAVEERWKSLDTKEIEFWRTLLQIRSEVNRVLESARNGKLIGASLDAKVSLFTSSEALRERLEMMSTGGEDADRLNRIFITSQAEVLPAMDAARSLFLDYTGSCSLDGNGDLWVGISRADGRKCERCWNYSVVVGTFLEHPTLCQRCHQVVKVLRDVKPAVLAA